MVGRRGEGGGWGLGKDISLCGGNPWFVPHSNAWWERVCGISISYKHLFFDVRAHQASYIFVVYVVRCKNGAILNSSLIRR